MATKYFSWKSPPTPNVHFLLNGLAQYAPVGSNRHHHYRYTDRRTGNGHGYVFKISKQAPILTIWNAATETVTISVKWNRNLVSSQYWVHLLIIFPLIREYIVINAGKQNTRFWLFIFAFNVSLRIIARVSNHGVLRRQSLCRAHKLLTADPFQNTPLLDDVPSRVVRASG